MKNTQCVCTKMQKKCAKKLRIFQTQTSAQEQCVQHMYKKHKKIMRKLNVYKKQKNAQEQHIF